MKQTIMRLFCGCPANKLLPQGIETDRFPPPYDDVLNISMRFQCNRCGRGHLYQTLAASNLARVDQAVKEAIRRGLPVEFS